MDNEHLYETSAALVSLVHFPGDLVRIPTSYKADDHMYLRPCHFPSYCTASCKVTLDHLGELCSIIPKCLERQLARVTGAVNVSF